MPEPLSSNALVPIDGEYQLQINEFDAAGRKTSFAMTIPDNVTAQEISLKLRTFILKKTTWKNYDVATILHAVIYADRMGLDIMAGDVYCAEGGRLSTTAGAKIRHAMASGKIEGYDVEITEGQAIEIPWETSKAKGFYRGPNLRAKVSISVKGWQRPVVYETTLGEWFMGGNPNWKSRPAYMLRRNALSKALEEVAPMGVESDEAPPIEQARTEAKAALEIAKANA